MQCFYKLEGHLLASRPFNMSLGLPSPKAMAMQAETMLCTGLSRIKYSKYRIQTFMSYQIKKY